MHVFDIFNRPEFSASALSDAIEVTANQYGRLDELGLFSHRPINRTYVEIEFKNQNGSLLLPTRERGAPPTENRPNQRNKRIIPTFHIPHSDFVTADDVQNALAFGSDAAVMQVATEVNERLSLMRDRHNQTHEYHRWGALDGQVYDADGSLLIDLWAEFGVTRTPISFDLANNAADMGEKTRDLKRRMELNLKGESMTGIHVFCSSGWFEDFIKHDSIKEAYKFYTSQQEPLRNDNRRGFSHNGVTYEEHVGQASYLAPNGSEVVRKFIADDKAVAVPLGTRQVFRHYSAPANRISNVNRAGRRIFAWQYRDPKDRFVELESQSNPLIICQRPDLVIPVDA